MKFKRIIFILFFLALSYIMFGYVEKYQRDNTQIDLSFKVKSDVADEYQLFYQTNRGDDWSEIQSFHSTYANANEWQTMSFTLPKKTLELRIDFGSNIATVSISDMKLTGVTAKKINLKELSYNENQLTTSAQSETAVVLKTADKDPFITFSAQSFITEVVDGTSLRLAALSTIISGLLGGFITMVVFSYRDIMIFFKTIFSGRRLIFSLGNNDFKTKYASSYLGITWGFIQPLMTIATYWFVFQIGLRSGNVSDTPFILWFLVAIVPWFFFSEAFSSATNVFSEYSYLVKKVVFKIELLPMVKITSAFFVHMFFLFFIFIIYSVYGYYPSLYNLQILYYVICSVALVISLSVLASALVLFFKDLNQIIMIILQIGFWFTPIGWSYTMLPTSWTYIFKLNPMFYIVEGFRDSFISHIPFYDHPYYTFYFWLFCLVTLVIGIKTFEKLKPHFADVI
ncbi:MULTISPECIES: ABC transporter permease [Paenibacillus]|uniref:Transport permease protein n=1 Tax=Paenibacillus odorifer TaxID=189426 RepID=A0ABX3HZ24_9BACL|nr:ABC transporter permease [Paenibacillus odorifer]OMD56060.1 ABC transporter permease [Paenibacillus odorifer]